MLAAMSTDTPRYTIVPVAERQAYWIGGQRQAVIAGAGQTGKRYALSHSTIAVGGTSALTFNLTNTNIIALTGLAFSDALPTGLVISTPNGLTGTCGGGTITALAGTGTLLETQLSAGSVDVTAYAVRTPSGGLNIILVNKDTLQNLTLTIQANQPVETASMQTMTGPSLAAVSGVTIQGATINKDGTFAPASAGTLTPAAGQTTCFLPALSAALISIT